LFIYLVRHGMAKSAGEDPERGLTADGEKDIEKIGASLKKRGLTLDNIFHSPKKRASQTAHIISDCLSHDGGSATQSELSPELSDGLLPEDDPEQWADRLEDMDCDTMLVGHLPYMGILTSLLRCGDEYNGVEDFSPGTVVCLERAGESYELLWKIAPGRS